MKLRWTFGLFIAVMLSGCAARPMVCVPVRVGGAPAFGCVDASAIDERITPWGGAPAPEVPEPEPSRPGIIPWSEKHGTHIKGETI